jgi:hypothetical protein
MACALNIQFGGHGAEIVTSILQDWIKKKM